MSVIPPPDHSSHPGIPLRARDVNGVVVCEGALVHILTIPDWLTHDLPEEDVLRLKACEGRAMRVLELDSYGYVWFGENNPWFCLRPSEVEILDSHGSRNA
jgi:hypothetical protein